MKKNISMRELILLGALIVIAAYYFMVQGPIVEEKEEIDALQAELDVQIDASEMKLVQMRSMEAAVEEVFAENPNPTQVIPTYNNINNILLELHTILDSTSDYSIDFDTETAEGDIARRSITIYFSVPSRESAIEKIRAIEESPNRYLIRDMSIVDNEDSSVRSSRDSARWDVTLNVTSFEYVKDAAALPVTEN